MNAAGFGGGVLYVVEGPLVITILHDRRFILVFGVGCAGLENRLVISRLAGSRNRGRLADIDRADGVLRSERSISSKDQVVTCNSGTFLRTAIIEF